MEERKTNWYANKKVVITLTAILASLVIGTAFAYYFAILKGENVNTAKTSGASLIYTEPTKGIETREMSDPAGMSNELSYDFTVSGQSKGNAVLKYGIYAEEESGNTIDASQIKVYLTDENNIPYDEYVQDVGEYWLAPNGESLEYNYGVDYELSFNYNNITGTDEGRTKYIEDALYKAYAASILGLEEGENFYIKTTKYDEETEEEAEVCLEYTLNYEYSMTESAMADEFPEANLSSCNASIGYLYDEATGNEQTSLLDNEGTPIVTATFQEYNAKIIEDGEEKTIPEGSDMCGYISEKTGKAECYIKKVYVFEDIYDYELQGFPKNLPGYCVNQDSKIVEDSNCASAYQQVVGKAVPKVLSEKSNYFNMVIGENSLPNPIAADAMSFENGGISELTGKGDEILEMRHYKNPRQYKLRYWISSDENIGKGEEPEGETTKQEVTTTDENNTHTVEFGGNEVFKFKINVYAIQG